MNKDYARIEQSIRYIRKNRYKQPGLEDVASQVGLSSHHFQRLFRRWVGISPKRYLEFLTVERGKQLLAGSRSVMHVAYELGLTSPSRLHEQFISVSAMTPGEYKIQAQGLEIDYGIHTGPFGDMLIAQTQRGVCMLSFINEATKDSEITRLKRLYSKAVFKQDSDLTAETAQRIFQPRRPDNQVPLAVKGTNFQINVWRALLQIPYGQVVSYQQLAHWVAKPKAVRAVANAVATNPVNMIIPCHRVLRADGAIGGYRGGSDLKSELLEWEVYSLEQDSAKEVNTK